MIFILIIIFYSLYSYIGNYITIIPICLLYINYYLKIKVKINNNEEDIKFKKKYKFLNKFNKKIENFNFREFILFNRYNNNKFFIFLIKIDTYFIFIFNNFLFFILFYLIIIIYIFNS